LLTDAALERLLPPETQRPEVIHRAMRHSVFAGGKRLRPILCIEAARMISASCPEGVEDLGSALEMLHTYSLIHDDLPALIMMTFVADDQPAQGIRRKPTPFSPAIALQTYAYEVLAKLRCRRSPRAHHRRDRA